MAKFALKALVLALSIFFVGCEFKRDFEAINSEKSYKFSFNGFEKRLDLGTQKPFALVFFTKDCGVCKEQIRILNELKAKNEGPRGLSDFDFFVVLNDAQDKEDAILFAKEKGIAFPLFYEKRASELLSRAVGGIYGVPVTVFFDKEGIQRELFIGLTLETLLLKELVKIL